MSISTQQLKQPQRKTNKEARHSIIFVCFVLPRHELSVLKIPLTILLYFDFPAGFCCSFCAEVYSRLGVIKYELYPPRVAWQTLQVSFLCWSPLVFLFFRGMFMNDERLS